MADQKRWFKVWVTLLIDMDNRPAEDVGHWTRLGCRIASVGTAGSVVFDSMAHAANFFHVGSPVEAGVLLARLPGIIVSDAPVRWPHGHDKPGICDGVAWCEGAGYPLMIRRGTSSYEEWCTRYGAVYVTMKNWRRYQIDSTVAQRMKSLRSKRRGEERRREEISPSPGTSPPDGSRNGTETDAAWPESLIEVRAWLVEHDAPPELHDPAFWRRIDDWLGAEDSGVAYLHECSKFLAWVAGLPVKQRPKDHRRSFGNWLRKSDYWRERRAQTEAHRRR